jgi:protein-S-isoprenylcysteine O-methyltransferase Ste14
MRIELSTMAARLALASLFSTALALAVIFLPAGSFSYWQAWVFLGVSTTCGGLTVFYLAKYNRALLERRLRSPLREQRGVQKLISAAVYLCLLLSVAVSAADHRFVWTPSSPALALAGNAIVVAGMYLYFLVYRENRFAAVTVEVTVDQQVITTGPYAVVRHPLYVALTTVAIGMPLALGSYVGLVFVIPTVALLVWRLLDEEALLGKSLDGYTEYAAHTRWRLIPRVF